MSVTLGRYAAVVAWAMGMPALIAADWPQWGGPRGDGVSAETGLITEWPAGGPPVVWHRELGQGYSSFAVVDAKAYTQFQNVWGQYVACVDVRTGATLWTYKYDVPYEAAGIYPGPRSTPCVSDGRVYAVSPDGEVFCIDAPSGKLVWSINTERRFRGEGTEFGYSASPRVVDGKLLLPIGGRDAAVVAFNAKTGDVLWTAGGEPASYCPVQIVELGAIRCVLAYLQNGLLLCRLDDGVVLWRTELSSGYDEHSVIPLVDGNQFLISAPFRAGATAYRWSIDDTSDPPRVTARVVWTSNKFSNDTASSVLVDGAIYGFDLRDPQAKAHRPSRGEFRCLDWETGDVQWSDPSVGHATVLAADGKLILFNDRGELILAEARSDAYRELGRAAVFSDEICWTAPALSDGLLFLRTQSRAACIDLRPSRRDAESRSAGEVSPVLRLDELPQTQSRWRWDWLLRGEREHPFMRPHFDELWLWYQWCCFAAVLPALGIGWVMTVCWRDRHWWSVGLTLGLMFALGCVASAVLNVRDPPRFVFTWPAALFVAFVAVLAVGHALEGRTLTWRGHIAARLALLAFLALCGAYFLALRRLSLPHEWVFLLGFLPAWWPASRWARALLRTGFSAKNVFAGGLAFSWYFWCCGGWQMFQSWRDGR